MPQYILTYVGGSQPASVEEGKAHMQRYMDWVDSLGEAAIVPQQALRGTEVLGDAAVLTPMMGYTILQVDNMATARAVAESCPFLEMDGAAMQISELVFRAR